MSNKEVEIKKVIDIWLDCECEPPENDRLVLIESKTEWPILGYFDGEDWRLSEFDVVIEIPNREWCELPSYPRKIR